MSEKPVHPQEPAEGAEEDVKAAGAEKASGSSAEGPSNEERAAEHTEEPAEGGKEAVEEPDS